ncbi:MAG: collagen-like triple helix repeat-containing protein [Polyangiales bacterium]
MSKLGVVAFACAVVTGTFIACSGPEGPAGATGAQGDPGAQGQKGDKGDTPDVGVFNPPDAATGSCTTPCHGFGNVVDQWKFSKHYIMNEMAADEPAWTSAGSCGNCHAIDGLERRIAGSVTIADGGVAATDVDKGHLDYKNASGGISEISYSGAGKTAIVHCTTCHAYTSKNDPHNTGGYTPGQAPLRVASGADDMSFIEKSPAGSTDVVGQAVGKWKAGNTCVFCHKSRKDVTFYVTPSNKISSSTWGPHEGPQTDVYSGKGGYHFAGLTYGTSVHTTLSNGCTSCHMQPVVDNKNVPDHSMHPKIDYCKTCHTTYTGTNFDVQSGQSNVKKALAELQGLLNAKGLLTRSTAKPYAVLQPDEIAGGAFDLDRTRPGAAADGTDLVIDKDTAGALYNYIIIARSGDFGVHNPTYAKQLLWDSIKFLKGSNPASLSSRPD